MRHEWIHSLQRALLPSEIAALTGMLQNAVGWRFPSADFEDTSEFVIIHSVVPSGTDEASQAFAFLRGDKLVIEATDRSIASATIKVMIYCIAIAQFHNTSAHGAAVGELAWLTA